MQEQEIWKDIPGYEGLYQVNQWGDIYSLYSNKKLKWSLYKDGYKIYNLHKKQKGIYNDRSQSCCFGVYSQPR